MSDQLSLIVAKWSDSFRSWRGRDATSSIGIFKERERSVWTLRSYHVDTVEHSISRSLNAAAMSCLKSFLVNDLKYAEDLIDIFRFGTLTFVIADWPCTLELLAHIRLLKCSIFIFLMHFASNSFIPSVLAYVIFLFHELDELLGVHIRLDRF